MPKQVRTPLIQCAYGAAETGGAISRTKVQSFFWSRAGPIRPTARRRRAPDRRKSWTTRRLQRGERPSFAPVLPRVAYKSIADIARVTALTAPRGSPGTDRRSPRPNLPSTDGGRNISERRETFSLFSRPPSAMEAYPRETKPNDVEHFRFFPGRRRRRRPTRKPQRASRARLLRVLGVLRGSASTRVTHSLLRRRRSRPTRASPTRTSRNPLRALPALAVATPQSQLPNPAKEQPAALPDAGCQAGPSPAIIP
jgi:hypothetical protein